MVYILLNLVFCVNKTEPSFQKIEQCLIHNTILFKSFASLCKESLPIWNKFIIHGRQCIWPENYKKIFLMSIVSIPPLTSSEKCWARGRGGRRKGNNYILKTQVSVYCRGFQFLAFKSSNKCYITILAVTQESPGYKALI